MPPISDSVRAFFFPDAAGDLRVRFYTGICLLGGILAMLGLPINVLQGLPLIVPVGSFCFGLICFGLYAAARRGVYLPGTLFVALLLVVNISWFPNAGSFGSPPYYFFVALLYPLVVYRDARRWVAIGAALANVVILLWLESTHPLLVTAFRSSNARFLDLAVGFLLSGGACVMILWVVNAGYHRERERLQVSVKALVDSQDQFARLFQLNPDAAYVIDPDKRAFLDVNEGFLRLTGWSRDAVVGHTGLDLNLWVDPTDRSRLYEQLQRYDRVDGFLSRFRRRDGREFWGSTSAGFLERGHRRLLLLTTRDVSEQIEAQKAVAESRALLSTLIDSTDDIVWLVDPLEYRLTAYNAAFASAARRTTGIEVYIGMGVDDFMSPHDAAEWKALYRRALDEGPFTLEYAVPGTSLVMLHSFNPVRHEEVTIGVSVFGKNITERKRAEEERDRIELQLFDSQKMESLGSLAGGVAHDFNNMLGGIMGYADLLLSDETDPVRQGHLGAIIRAATRSSELTRKLLAFGRRGKNIVEAVELNVIVRDSVTMLKPSFRQDVQLELRLDATWTLDGDPSQLNQLVVNLCINANEAMPRGGTLGIRTADVTLDETTVPHVSVPNGHYVELRVSDAGVGMTDDVKARLFEPFFTTKVRGTAPGTGLGLSTVYGIVHLHHGTITVESAPGQGAVFTVYFPKGALAPQQKPASAQAGRGHGLILLVEDEPLLRDFTSAALGRLGYQAVTAADGEEAVRVFKERRGDITGIILDLRMPRKSGREAFLEIREIDPKVPVLICSGYGDNEEAQGLITLGARGLLPKPFRLADLSDQLSRLE